MFFARFQEAELSVRRVAELVDDEQAVITRTKIPVRRAAATGTS